VNWEMEYCSNATNRLGNPGKFTLLLCLSFLSYQMGFKYIYLFLLYRLASYNNQKYSEKLEEGNDQDTG
jgi:hypothetical protein